MAMLGHGPRSATAVADAKSVVHVLTIAGLDEFTHRRPRLGALVLANLARRLSDRQRATTEALRAG